MTRFAVGIGFWIGAAVAMAAEPPAPAATVAVTQPAAAPVQPSGSEPPKSEPGKTGPERPLLDLRVGDIRRYLTPEELRVLRDGPVDEANTVIVQADAPLLPMKSQLDVPGGIIAPFWALANPHKAWRLFLPDPRVNIKDIPPPESKIPPPVFRWGP